MTTWIHFTKSTNFKLTRGGGDSISREYGLFVYKFTDDFPLEEMRAKWAYRDVIFIKCDDKYVDSVQDDPLCRDPSLDEYVIKSMHFNKCQVARIAQ